MLRLTFHAGKSDTPTVVLAFCLRFCADGTLRGGDNYVVARCVEGLWHVAGREHRELECEGPVNVRITGRDQSAPVHRGPFQKLRTANGVLHGDDANLRIAMPGRISNDVPTCHEITFLRPATASRT